MYGSSNEESYIVVINYILIYLFFNKFNFHFIKNSFKYS